MSRREEPMMVKVIARFLHARTGLPLSEKGIRACLYDRDIANDDRLAECPLNPQGEAHWLFELSRAASADSPREQSPDLYAELDTDGNVFFQTPVTENLDFITPDRVSGERNRQTAFLGEFHVNLPELRA